MPSRRIDRVTLRGPSPALPAAAAHRRATVAATRRAASAGLASLLALLAVAAAARGQAAPADLPSSDKLRIGGDNAFNWAEGSTRVLFIDGHVSLATDDATLSADRAVVWLTPVSTDATPGAGTTQYRVEIALLGSAKVARGDVTREGGELFVTMDTRPDVELQTETLTAADHSGDVHYLAASQLRRRASESPSTPMAAGSPTSRPFGTTEPTSQPTSRPARPPREPLTFNAAQVTTQMTPEGRVAIILNGDDKHSDILLAEPRPDGSRLELQAQHAVLFTTMTDARQVLQGGRLEKLDPDRDIEAAYLEGDVRVHVTPAHPAIEAEQSLHASRIVYEFATDRAVLTDVLFHTYDPRQPAPMVVRARAMQQLSATEFVGDHATISTSDFNTPAISLKATKVTIRQEETGDPRLGARTNFVADNVTPRIYGLPVFYLPKVWGSTTENGGLPLRQIQFSQTTNFGFGVESKWGLYETLGGIPPQGLDADYRLDYFAERGPAFGLDATYSGGNVNEATLQPWSYVGDFTGYILEDDGTDKLGKRRARISHADGDIRGRIRWDHQQFLSDNWQVQARVGYVSDPTFMEEWFRSEFRGGMPEETSLYVKRSDGNEFFSVLINPDLNNVPTVADQLQEVRVTPRAGNGLNENPLIVEQLPEIRYDRIGESLADDRATLFSNNSLAGLHFSESYADLTELGFRDDKRTTLNDFSPGIPSYGWTGYTGNYVVRGDTRQEIDLPMGNDKFRIVPYGMARYTAYSDSPGGDERGRLLVGSGIRSSTQFYKVYDDAESKLFDIHRVRHIIEPQVNLFASAQTRDRTDFYDYEEDVDGISDVEVAQLAVRQRFQTKRGGPGMQRSVDFLTFNTGVNLFGNQPTEPSVNYQDANPRFSNADAFRGVFFDAEPEASVARSTAWADATWRVSDTFAVLTDASYNLDHAELATAGVGVAVQRDPRVSYFVGARYIGDTVNSTIGTLSIDYELTQRYSIGFNESFNFTEGANQNTSLDIIRRFEQFIFSVSFYYDQIDGTGGISFSLSPRNIPAGFRSNGSSNRR